MLVSDAGTSCHHRCSIELRPLLHSDLGQFRLGWRAEGRGAVSTASQMCCRESGDWVRAVTKPAQPPHYSCCQSPVLLGNLNVRDEGRDSNPRLIATLATTNTTSEQTSRRVLTSNLQTHRFSPCYLTTTSCAVAGQINNVETSPCNFGHPA